MAYDESHSRQQSGFWGHFPTFLLPSEYLKVPFEMEDFCFPQA